MTFPHRILLVDDDPMLCQTLCERLGDGGYAVTVAATGAAALDLAGGHDLAMVNDVVADVAGADLCRRLKQDHPGLPVVCLGAGMPGVDAVVAKPIRLAALMGVVADILSRSGTRVLTLGPWRFHPDDRLLAGEDGERVRLTGKEAAILSVLAAAGGVVSREGLLAEIWGYSASVTTHTLETHVYRLRRKLERGPASAHILITEDGGYRLNL